jgi:hypothetical protein
MEILPDRLCGLVVRVPGYRFRGQIPIPGDTRFSEKLWVWNGIHSASWIQLRSYLKEKVEAPVYKTEITGVGIGCTDTRDFLSAIVGTYFADMRRSLGQYSSLAN